MLDSLAGRKVLVTGAGSGIGLAIARHFLDAGAIVGANILPGDEQGRAALDLPREMPKAARLRAKFEDDIELQLNAMLGDKSIYRSPGALGPAYEHPEAVKDEDIEIYLRPHLRNEQRTHDLERFVGAFDNKHTLAIEPQLRQLKAPTLIVWATDDVYFPVKWAHWLAEAIPGARPPVELSGARLFFPEERADAFNQLLRGHWVG